MKIALTTFLLLLTIWAIGDLPREILAQENTEPFLQCASLGPEIPVGKVADETDKFSQEVIRLMLQLAQNAKAQRSAAGNLLTTSNECKANRCISSCAVVKKACVAQPEKGCGGEACPRQEIQDELDTVYAYYDEVRRTNKELSDLLHKAGPSPFVTADYCGSNQCNNDYGISGCTQKCRQRTWREHILFNLEEARRGLQACVTPANFYKTGESDQDVDFPVSCQEARSQGLLSEKQAQCFNNNFFCCTM